MGCNSSTNNTQLKIINDEDKRNIKIDKQQLSTQIKDSNIIKLLYLGAGESGKSTLFKQMRRLYGDQFDKEELEDCLPAIYFNIMSNILITMENSLEDTYNFEFDDKELIQNFLKEHDQNTPIDEKIGENLRKIWSDKGIKEMWKKRSNFQVIDCLEYFLLEENISRIEKEDYVPTTDDMLHTRIKTSGITREEYKIDDRDYEIFDVGGQRNERKKWIHCFADVTAVIFVAAINEYDQVLYEDHNISRISESLKLFAQTINSEHFVDSAIILFFNKMDLFESKIKDTPIKVEGERYNDFQGDPHNIDDGKQYFQDLFLAQSKSNKDVYVHFTTATNKENVLTVFQACQDVILQKNLKSSGFIS